MALLFPLMLLAAAAQPADRPRTYLASVVDIPLARDQSVESFAFKTWGVEFNAVCHIPSGWRITAGSSATPDGDLSGRGSHGATWFSKSSPEGLKDFALITLHDEVQLRDKGPVPATFKGKATLNTDDGEITISLTAANIRLRAAPHCPEAKP